MQKNLMISCVTLAREEINIAVKILRHGPSSHWELQHSRGSSSQVLRGRFFLRAVPAAFALLADSSCSVMNACRNLSTDTGGFMRCSRQQDRQIADLYRGPQIVYQICTCTVTQSSVNHLQHLPGACCPHQLQATL